MKLHGEGPGGRRINPIEVYMLHAPDENVRAVYLRRLEHSLRSTDAGLGFDGITLYDNDGPTPILDEFYKIMHHLNSGVTRLVCSADKRDELTALQQVAKLCDPTITVAIDGLEAVICKPAVTIKPLRTVSKSRPPDVEVSCMTTD